MNVESVLLDTLQATAPVLEATCRDRWWVIGSAAMVLSGVPGVTPLDVDVLCSRRDAEAVRESWSDHLDCNYVPADDARFRSLFARFQHLPMPVEVMGGLEVKTRDGWQHVIVEAQAPVAGPAGPLPVPTLDEQIRILQLFGREKDLVKVRHITAFLSRTAPHVH